MIEAHLEKKSYTNRKVGPEGDLFVFGLKHILCSVDVREKSLILVSFHGNHCHKFLQVPQVFKLPDHLRHLLQKIHRLDPSAISSYSVSISIHYIDSFNKVNKQNSKVKDTFYAVIRYMVRDPYI